MKQYKNLRILNKANNKVELYIYGDIVSDNDKWFETDVTDMEIKEFLDEIKDAKELDIYINSGGGSVFAGMAIYNMLSRHKAKKTVYVDGLAASIASVIALVGDTVYIPSNAYFMIHRAWGFEVGNAEDMLKMAETLEKIDQGILNVYKEKLRDGITEQEIWQMMQDETWFTGDEAEKYFKNILATEPVKASACISKDLLNKYKNVPEIEVQDNIKPLDEVDDDFENKLNMLALELDFFNSFLIKEKK